MKTRLLATLIGLAALTSAPAADLAPASIVGLVANGIITNGTGFFAPSGAYRLTVGETAITQVPLTSNIFAQTFTYTYKKTGEKTAQVTITDIASGLVGTETLVFETAARAAFTLTSTVGTQWGTLVFEYAPPGSKLINISTRGEVGAGDKVLIAGFVLSAETKVLIRAIGPGLVKFGVTGLLPDPKVQVFRDGSSVGFNDDWNGDSKVAAAITATGAFALDDVKSKDAAVVYTFPAGSYTAQVSGANGTTGVALIEIYEVP